MQLTLSPSPVLTRDERLVVSPLNAYLGALGGITSLAIMALTVVHSALVSRYGHKYQLCAGGVAPWEQAKAEEDAPRGEKTRDDIDKTSSAAPVSGGV